MKSNSITTIFISLICLSTVSYADEPGTDLDIFAKRGKGVVTQEDFTARADMIPESSRKGTLRDRKRVNDLLQSLLLTSQLVADAHEAGFDKEQVVIKRMQLAANTELANAWLTHYVDSRSTADYEALAHENFLLNQKSIMSQPKVDVSHILISTEERPDADAEALAESISLQVIENPSAFDELVIEYSEDPSAASNKGKFRNVKKGDMVKAFEETAFALQPGEISTPVKTAFGYHIIRLDGRTEPEQMAFEDVKERLIALEREKHVERVRRDYLDSLNSIEIEMTDDQLMEMVRRQFGEEYINSQTPGIDSE
jgi:parvulin-like peptidyl-prolyl isomerase